VHAAAAAVLGRGTGPTGQVGVVPPDHMGGEVGGGAEDLAADGAAARIACVLEVRLDRRSTSSVQAGQMQERPQQQRCHAPTSE
jgi:hypothetical protein